MRRLETLAVASLATLLVALPPAFAASYTAITFDVPFPDARFTAASGINDFGVVVGVYGDDDGERGFVYADGRFSTLDVPFAGAVGTTPQGINNAGAIVGTYRDDAGTIHGFLYERRRYSILDVPLAIETNPSGINDRGEIVGVYCEALAGGACRPHGFHYLGGRFTTLDAPFAGATATRAFGINNYGQIVGDYDDGTGTRPYYYDGGRFSRLGDLDSSITGRGVNDHGQVVGLFLDGDRRNFVYYRGQFNMLPLAVSAEALGINNRGQIVGFYFEDGRARGFVATREKRAPDGAEGVPTTR